VHANDERKPATSGGLAKVKLAGLPETKPRENCDDDYDQADDVNDVVHGHPSVLVNRRWMQRVCPKRHKCRGRVNGAPPIMTKCGVDLRRQRSAGLAAECKENRRLWQRIG
jgi:hypothetical protein